MPSESWQCKLAPPPDKYHLPSTLLTTPKLLPTPKSYYPSTRLGGPATNTPCCFWHSHAAMPHPHRADPENAGTSTSWSTTMAQFRKRHRRRSFSKRFFSVFDSISYGARSSLPRRTYYGCCTVGNAMRTRPSERTKNGGRRGEKYGVPHCMRRGFTLLQVAYRQH
jgi:hypothetical protein